MGSVASRGAASVRLVESRAETSSTATASSTRRIRTLQSTWIQRWDVIKCASYLFSWPPSGVPCTHCPLVCQSGAGGMFTMVTSLDGENASWRYQGGRELDRGDQAGRSRKQAGQGVGDDRTRRLIALHAAVNRRVDGWHAVDADLVPRVVGAHGH